MKKQLLALSLAAALFLGAAGCSKPTESSETAVQLQMDTRKRLLP